MDKIKTPRSCSFTVFRMLTLGSILTGGGVAILFFVLQKALDFTLDQTNGLNDINVVLLSFAVFVVSIPVSLGVTFLVAATQVYYNNGRFP